MWADTIDFLLQVMEPLNGRERTEGRGRERGREVYIIGTYFPTSGRSLSDKRAHERNGQTERERERTLFPLFILCSLSDNCIEG